MKLLDIMTSPWMIAPEKLNEIRAIYQAHMRGDKIDIKGITAKVDLTAKSKSTAEKDYDVVNGAAIIPIMDVITKYPSFWSFFFGGTSSLEVARLFGEAMNDSSVASIILNIDSPGGTVDGTQELAELIYSSRGSKPIIAYTDGMIASAAYYIGAAADAIYISGDMPVTGSIGVVATHIDVSKAYEEAGYKITEIYAGKYKRIASSYKPLTEDGAGYIQDQVDYIYSIFVDDIAKYRGVSVKQVLENMADGKIFIGRQAIDAGLVDGVSTFDRLINIELPVMQSNLSAEAWLENLNKEFKHGSKIERI